MFKEARSRIPSLSTWLEFCYSCPSVLHFGDHTINSICGVQQGDPLGPLGFALTLHPIIEKVKSEVPGLLANSWYLDDGTLCGSPVDLNLALSIIEELAPTWGLSLNCSKSLLFILKEDSPPQNSLPTDIPTTSKGFVLLGSPIGPPSFCNSFIQKRVTKLKHTLSFLPDLQDSQMDTTLLKSCLAFPKISFFLRTCPPSYIRDATTSFDSVIYESLSDLVGGPLPDWSWTIASLPTSLGGLSIRRASLHSSAAYIGSVSSFQFLMAEILGYHPNDLSQLTEAFCEFSSASRNPDWSSPDAIHFPLYQSHLSRAIDQSSFDYLLSNAPSSRLKALALSSAIPYAGDWLNVIPSLALGLHLHDQEFRRCLQYWFGVKMFSVDYPCPFCKSSCDPYGDHQIECGGNKDRIYRHDSIRDPLFSSAQSAALCPKKEMPSLIPVSKRVSFVPLLVETIGGWIEKASHTITSIGRLLGQRLRFNVGDTTRHLFQRLSISLWKGNSAMWLSRSPTPSPSVDGVM